MTARDHLPQLKRALEEFRRAGRDFPPHVLAERGGTVQLVCWAPRVDRDMGLHACAVLRAALDPDFLTLAVDAFIRHLDPAAAKSTLDDYRRGDFQKQVAANRRADIRDALSVVRVGRDGAAELLAVPYTAFEAHDPVYWDEPQGGPDREAQGLVADALRQIMTGPTLRDAGLFRLAAAAFPDLSPERQDYHFRRAAVTALEEVGFTVMGSDELGRQLTEAP